MTKRVTIPDATWQAICNAWGGRCAYCAAPSTELQADHVDAVSRGGSPDIDNVVPACPKCNSNKRAHTLSTWLLRRGMPQGIVAPTKEGEEDEYTHPVRWMRSAWDRIAQAADVIQAREHRKMKPVDVIRRGTLRYVDEVLDTRDEPPRPAA